MIDPDTDFGDLCWVWIWGAVNVFIWWTMWKLGFFQDMWKWLT